MSGTTRSKEEDTGFSAQVPELVHNTYFTYAHGCRETEQIWHAANGVTIYVQGAFPEEGMQAGSVNYSHFAKKHLLTFKGGKAERQGDFGFEGKAKAILSKRLSGREGYGDKLGGAMDAAKNTVVFCDMLEKDKLIGAFESAIVKASATRIKHFGPADVYFPMDCVFTFKMNSKKPEATCGIRILWSRSANGKTFVVYHLDKAIR